VNIFLIHFKLKDMSFANAMLPIQKGMLDLPYGRDTRYRTIQALIDSSANNNALTVTDFGQNGKKRTAKISYFPIDCDVEGSCSTNICDAAEVAEPVQRFFDISRCTAIKPFAINVEDFRNIDGTYTFTDGGRQQFMRKFDAARALLNSQLNAWLVGNVGCQPDGTPVKKVSLTDPNTAAIRPKGLFEIERTLQDAGLINPYIIGGGEVFTWEKGLTIGGLNAQGQRIDQVRLGNVYYDKGLEDSFGDNTEGHLVAYAADAVKFIAWSDNAGMFATDMGSFLNGSRTLETMYREGDTFYHGTIVDPLTGLIWDLDIVYDVCDKQWKFQFKIKWDIFLMPEYRCNLDCVNGIFHFTTCIPAPVECPDVTPPTPLAQTVFEWTPSAEDLTYIGKITLGGVDSEINATVANVTELAAALNANFAKYKFTAVGSDIQYTGYSAISGSANGGTITIEFAPATT
jgi:hypothetical protein